MVTDLTVPERRFYFGVLAVEMPSSAYGGHHPIRPERSGKTPRYAQEVRGPTNASDRTPIPTTTRTIRSVFPMFGLIACSQDQR
jgi:hypothetical protein